MGAVIDEIRYGTGKPPPYLEKGKNTVPFVRATDIKDGEVNVETLLHVAVKQPKRMEKCRLVGGELIIVRSGVNTGDCAVIPKSLADAYAAYDLILTLQPTASVKFVSAFLDTEIGRLQLNLVKGRAAQPHINAEEVSAIRVPLPEDIEVQNRFVSAMDAARSERRGKLEQADALLNGLDDFLLDALGFTPTPEDSRRVFAVRLDQVRREGALNADYYHPERILALRALVESAKKLRTAPLHSVVVFERNQIKAPGENYLSLAHVQSGTGELVDANENATGACFTYKTNDVLFGRLRPYLNKVYRAEMNGCCSPEFHVLRVMEDSDLLPAYLAAILRSRLVLAQTVHMMTGNTHPRLANDDVANLEIPIPRREVQQTVADEVLRRRGEARRLRAEAEASWQAARQWFEDQLLAPAP